MYTIAIVYYLLSLGLSSLCYAAEKTIQPFQLMSDAISIPIHFTRDECKDPEVLQFTGADRIAGFDTTVFFTIVWKRDNGSLASDIYKCQNPGALNNFMPIKDISIIRAESDSKSDSDKYRFVTGTYEFKRTFDDSSIHTQTMLMALCSYAGQNPNEEVSSSLILLSAFPPQSERFNLREHKKTMQEIVTYFQRHVFVCTNL